MKPSVLRQVLLYRYRYQSGVALFVILLIALLVLRIDIAPTGLTDTEMQSAVSSATLKLSYPFEQSLVDLPYKLLQKVSLSVFGLHEWSLILPSLILGVATGVAFLMMVRRWFRLNVALITSFIFVTSAAFLTISRTGTSMIMTTFWLSIILLAVTNILHPKGRSKLWAAILLVALPLSLYTPLMAYPLLAISIAGVLHPHVRFMAKKLDVWKYVVGIVIIALLLAPLVLWIIKEPDTLKELIGLPDTIPSWAALWFNLKFVLKSVLNVGNATIGMIPQPIFGAASLIIILLGFLKTVVDRHSARSYMLMIWTALFIPVIVLNPDKILICLVPAYLYMAIGVETLIREWYKLFPLNPYARLAGLIPLTILLGGIMISNTAQYFYGHFYGTPNTVYRQQLSATEQVIKNAKPTDTIHVVTTSQEYSFYDLLRRDHKNVRVHNSLQEKPSGIIIIHAGASYSPARIGDPKEIVTSYVKGSDAVVARVFQ